MLPSNSQIQIYDTTLRDGAQMQGISFSVADKLKIFSLLSDFGVPYIEGGWPGSNPKDIAFFEQAQKFPTAGNKLVAFGSTMRAGSPSAPEDPTLKALLAVNTQTVTIVGKSWDFHVREALRIELDENLRLIRESIAHLKAQQRQVFFDAEHFFDAYRANPEYALKVLASAAEAGADCLILCDTNGGSLPSWVKTTIEAVRESFPLVALGIHAHNDSGLAVANSLAAVEAGVIQIQGTINGYGERCGNADLVQIICNLELKTNYAPLIEASQLSEITALSHKISEIANMNPQAGQPFVGRYAFAHKGGLHASAMARNPLTYEHIDPALVGNLSKVLVSEQSGISNLLSFCTDNTIDLGANPNEKARDLLTKIKIRENSGHQFEGADASLTLFILGELGIKPSFFEVLDFRVLSTLDTSAEATVRVRVGEDIFHTASLGVGPGHALDSALRKVLANYYAPLKDFKLTDFKVRVVDSQDGTAAKTRVSVEMDFRGDTWITVGVHENILQATFWAISESVEYGLFRFVQG